MSNDRTLMAFHTNMAVYMAYVIDGGFSDLPELSRWLQGMRNEINQLEVKACSIAGEEMDRVAREERETSIPPLAS